MTTIANLELKANENNLALLISPFNTLSNMSNTETQPESDPQSRKKPKPKQRTLPGTSLKSASPMVQNLATSKNRPKTMPRHSSLWK